LHDNVATKKTTFFLQGALTSRETWKKATEMEGTRGWEELVMTGETNLIGRDRKKYALTKTLRFDTFVL
jgi:hypothetical protein